MAILPALPPVPMPPLVGSFFSSFPLVVYPAPSTSTPPPSKPTLWLLGPPPVAANESLDPACRQAQALARFTGLECQVRWCTHSAGAPGEQLPALHLPNGELLSKDELVAHLSSSPKGAGSSPPKEAPAMDPNTQAYLSLLSTSLLPAVFSSLYLSPSPTPITPRSDLPYLTSLVLSFQAHSVRTARIAEVKKLRGGKEGSKKQLDLETVERDGVEALGALEAKLRATEAEGPWFGGAQSPTPLDAKLYALLSIIQLLPHKDAAPLKEKLERCPSLTAWVREKGC